MILKYGSIFNWLRQSLSKAKFFKELFDCSLCLGTWTGFIVGLLSPYNFLLVGFSVAASSWIFDHVILLLKVKIWPDEEN